MPGRRGTTVTGAIIRSAYIMVNETEVIGAFHRLFPECTPTVIARGPGRVNLIGEHVDYNHGLVLPIAIDRAVWAIAGPCEGSEIAVHSVALEQTASFDPRRVAPPSPPRWDAYPKGVAAGLIAAGVEVPGARILIDSDRPLGGGLSSSAAFEVAIGRALLELAAVEMGAADLARLCRRAEHDYAGVPCGIMDQFTSVMGLAEHALFIDCRDERVHYIRWPDPDVVVLIAESAQRHDLAESPYATRVDECRAALEHFQRTHDDVATFRDVTASQVRAAQAALDATLFRRARHVVTEIRRTADAAKALERGDFDALGRLMNESHESLRTDYQVSSPGLDRLARFIRDMPNCFGGRMTGAGFGGCIVAMVKREAVPAIESALRNWYDDEGATDPHFFTTVPSAGASTKLVGDA